MEVSLAPEPANVPEDLEALARLLTAQLDDNSTAYLRAKGLDPAVLKRFEVGMEPSVIGFVPTRPSPGALSGRITIPIRDTAGRLVDIIGHAPDDRIPKYRSLTNAQGTLFGAHVAAESPFVILCGGILEALVLLQNDLPAVAVPDCFSFNEAHVPFFSGRQVFVAFAQDEAGRREMLRVAGLLKPAAKHVYAVALPPGIKDIADLFAKVPEPAAVFQSLIQQAVHASLSSGFPSDAHYLDAFFEEVAKRRAERANVSTGLPILDVALGGGLYPGLYVVSSGIGGGKTVLLRQLCDALASQGLPVIHFSYGATAFQLWATSMAQRIQTPIHDIFSGNVRDETLHEASADYREAARRIWTVECMPDTTISYITEVTEQIIRTTETVPCLILDSIERLYPDDGPRVRPHTKEQRLEWAHNQMHHLARQLGTIVFIAAYKNEQPGEYDPAIATADVYLRLEWEKETDDLREGSIFVVKNRHGEEGRCGVRYDKRTLTYYA